MQEQEILNTTMIEQLKDIFRVWIYILLELRNC
jgi:hypothetical protein